MRMPTGLLVPSDIYTDDDLVVRKTAQKAVKNAVRKAALLFSLTASVAVAGNVSIYQCDGDNGEPVFSNAGCENNQRMVSLGEMSVIEGGSAQSLRQQAKAVRDLPVEMPAKRNPLEKKPRAQTFGERVELRKLTMRADGLRRDLRRAVSGGARLTLKKELHDVERKIQQRQK